MRTTMNGRRRGLAGLLLAGVVAGALTGCGVRQRRQEAATANAAATATAQAASGLTNPTLAPATPDDQGDAVERELEAISTELSDSDTIDDLETALPPDEPTDTPAAEAATPAPAATSAEVTGSAANEQGVELEALLEALQGQLDQTDTVADAANP
ncbi:MAG: hypothetical protein IT317_18600 [Anaerolineales bacterium]|nr:hypothetical protein [Anaerolineales bacterium]